ncbi:hypothetical protein [Sutcliffiella horikoshii]|nr:hypothetical protein [Sutcliffiella horikoshii]
MIKFMTIEIVIGKLGNIGNTVKNNNLINLVTCPESFGVCF